MFADSAIKYLRHTKTVEVAGNRSEAPPRSRRLVPSVAFLAFSVGIGLLFFFDGRHADYASLSNDQFNIIPVCAKKDNPNLFSEDEIVGDLNRVSYYTPFFVDTIRYLAWPDRNYFRALNLLVLITTIIYMCGWWLLFSNFTNGWLAAAAAFFVRGIIWLPGNEFWGIAGIWSMVPRTLFLAFLPWLIWLWFRYRRSSFGWLIVSFGCGLLANVHPISGVAVAVGLYAAEFAWTFADTKSVKTALRRCLVGGVFVLIGASPFIWTYVSQVGGKSGIDMVEFDQALRMRLKPFFFLESAYLREWLRPQLMLLAFLPWLGYLLIGRRELRKYRTAFLAMAVFSVGCILASALPFPAEAILDRFGYHPRFAFQLVRAGKYALVPSFILVVVLADWACREVSRRLRIGPYIVGAVCVAAIIMTMFARLNQFNRVPILGDDVTRFLWPSAAGPTSSDEVDSLGPVLKWIAATTVQDARFVGPRQIRMGAFRPVLHDWSGAVMLIEGDPKAFVLAARRERELRSPEYRDPLKKAELLASWGTDFWVVDFPASSLPQVYSDSLWHVYDLRSMRPSKTDKSSKNQLDASLYLR